MPTAVALDILRRYQRRCLQQTLPGQQICTVHTGVLTKGPTSLKLYVPAGQEDAAEALADVQTDRHHLIWIAPRSLIQDLPPNTTNMQANGRVFFVESSGKNLTRHSLLPRYAGIFPLDEHGSPLEEMHVVAVIAESIHEDVCLATSSLYVEGNSTFFLTPNTASQS